MVVNISVGYEVIATHEVGFGLNLVEASISGGRASGEKAYESKCSSHPTAALLGGFLFLDSLFTV
jgi:hypothetical protein